MKKLVSALFLTAAFTSGAFAGNGSGAMGPLVECKLDKGTIVMTAMACDMAKRDQNTLAMHYPNRTSSKVGSYSWEDPSEKTGGGYTWEDPSEKTGGGYTWEDPSKKTGGGYTWEDPSKKTGGGYTWEDPSEKTGGGFV